MRKFLDEAQQTAVKLQNLGEKTVQNAAERIDELRPAVREGVDKAVDGAKDVWDKTQDHIERALLDAKTALGRAIESLSAADEIPMPPVDEASEKSDRPLTAQEEIDLEVEDRIAKIRSAQQAPGAFSDYISKKFGKDK